MNKGEYFICIGAGTHQLSLIKAAKELGFKIIAVDKNIKAPGMKLASIKIQCDITDSKSIIQKISQEKLSNKIAGVGSRSYGLATSSSIDISKHYQTPGPSLKDVNVFLDKRHLKTKLQDHEVLVPHRFDWYTKDQLEILRNANLPLLARPSNGHGKLGLEIIYTQNDLDQFLKKNPVDNGSLLVESIIEGKEYTVLGLVKNGVYETVTITDKTTSLSPPLFVELQHTWPSSLSQTMQKKIASIMQNITTIMGLQNSPLVAEFLISQNEDIDEKNKQAYLVECNPETGGEYLADILFPRIFPHWNYFQELVKINTQAFDSEKTKRDKDYANKQTTIIRFISQKEGLFKKITFPDRLQKHKDLILLKTLKENNTKTDLYDGNSGRLAVFALSSSKTSQSTMQDEIISIEKEIGIHYE